MFVTKNVMPVFLQQSAQSDRMPDLASVACHITSREAYSTMLQRVQKNAKLAHNIKSAVWNVDRACAHAKNTQWALQYWTKLQHADDAHTADYGYSRDTRGRTIFASM